MDVCQFSTEFPNKIYISHVKVNFVKVLTAEKRKKKEELGWLSVRFAKPQLIKWLKEKLTIINCWCV